MCREVSPSNSKMSRWLYVAPPAALIIQIRMDFILMDESFKSFICSSSQLYDLMTMAFKYQVLLCLRPKDILLVSFNHMDAIKDFVKDTPSILSQVDETYRQLIEVRNV